MSQLSSIGLAELVVPPVFAPLTRAPLKEIELVDSAVIVTVFTFPDVPLDVTWQDGMTVNTCAKPHVITAPTDVQDDPVSHPFGD